MNDTDKSEVELRKSVTELVGKFNIIATDHNIDNLMHLITQQCNQARLDERSRIKKVFDKLRAGIFAIDFYIKHPYPDDARWTPKSRWIEPRVEDVLDALDVTELQAQAKETEKE